MRKQIGEGQKIASIHIITEEEFFANATRVVFLVYLIFTGQSIFFGITMPDPINRVVMIKKNPGEI